MVWIHNFDISVSCNIFSGNGTFAFFGNAQGLRLIIVDAETDALQVEHDVNDVFFDAGNGCKLVGHAFNFKTSDSCSSNAR